ncbi:hypothetical protein ABZU94_10685 [Streptomyces mirabilis]|uniref:hypothetical protein n=1 Tax=Streptomyces sp. NPDC005388 TaxID=3156717 RepID=UPI0033B9F6BD
MIGEILLGVGAAGASVCFYFVAPAGRGIHRHVVPRAVLRAQIARLEQEADSMVCAVSKSLTDVQAARVERDEAWEALNKAERLVADLEKQLRPFDELCAENTQLRADLDNARAMRQLSAGPRPPDDASCLPDDVQEFVDATATAWRASA